jgi:quercetin dioxygenase-like cupin family protein
MPEVVKKYKYSSGEIIMKLSKRIAIALGLLVLGANGSVFAQSVGLTRTLVLKEDVSVPNREAVIARVEITPGGVADWHTHPGDEISYVADGDIILLVAGQSPRKIIKGEGFVVPAGIVHSAKNEGATPIQLVGVYVVEKGKPLASPAPAPAQ